MTSIPGLNSPLSELIQFSQCGRLRLPLLLNALHYTVGILDKIIPFYLDHLGQKLRLQSKLQVTKIY